MGSKDKFELGDFRDLKRDRDVLVSRPQKTIPVVLAVSDWVTQSSQHLSLLS